MQNISELEAHIKTLCETHNITVQDRVSGGGRSWKKTRTVSIKPIKSMKTYFIALHEIGHIVHPLGSGSGLRLEKEYYAWEWAIENSLVDPNASAAKMIHRCLDSYIQKARRSPRMKLPAKEHPLWALVAEMNSL